MTIDIEKLAEDTLELVKENNDLSAYNYMISRLKQFAEAYAAKVLEDKESEIAEFREWDLAQKSKLITQNVRITELQANINDLREALEYWSKVINYQYSGSKEAMSFLQQADELAQQALSKTPAQSLQERENEVIERCAKVCDDASQPHQDEIHTDAQWAAKVMAANIRALKGK